MESSNHLLFLFLSSMLCLHCFCEVWRISDNLVEDKSQKLHCNSSVEFDEVEDYAALDIELLPYEMAWLKSRCSDECLTSTRCVAFMWLTLCDYHPSFYNQSHPCSSITFLTNHSGACFLSSTTFSYGEALNLSGSTLGFHSGTCITPSGALPICTCTCTYTRPVYRTQRAFNMYYTHM